MTGFNGFTDLDGFNTYAQLINENGAISLVHDGHKFIRDRIENGRGYWRCRSSFRFNCKARMVTKSMENGHTMLKVRHGVHDHIVKKIVKRGRRKAKLKQSNVMALKKNVRAKKRLLSKTFAIPTKLPKLVPKPTLKVPKMEPKTEIVADMAKYDGGENVENYSSATVDDPENDIVDILD